MFKFSHTWRVAIAMLIPGTALFGCVRHTSPTQKKELKTRSLTKKQGHTPTKVPANGNSLAALLAKSAKAPAAPKEKRCHMNFKIKGMT